MPSSAAKEHKPEIISVAVTPEVLRVDLSDGRCLSVPLEWFPRLLQDTQGERNSWRLIGHGEGVHWELLDEDISVEGLLAGRGSAESPASFRRWLAGRQNQ